MELLSPPSTDIKRQLAEGKNITTVGISCNIATGEGEEVDGQRAIADFIHFFFQN